MTVHSFLPAQCYESLKRAFLAGKDVVIGCIVDVDGQTCHGTLRFCTRFSSAFGFKYFATF